MRWQTTRGAWPQISGWSGAPGMPHCIRGEPGTYYTTTPQEFEIVVKCIHDRTIDNVVDVALDGVPIRSVYVTRVAGQTSVLRGALASETELKRFSFGQLTLKEDDPDASESDARDVKDMGTIHVNVRAVTRGEAGNVSPFALKLPGDVAVSEKAKKAGSHAAKLGKTDIIPRQTSYIATNLSQYAHRDIVFHYAPLDLLIAREIVIPPPDPQPSSGRETSGSGGVDPRAAKDNNSIVVKKEKSSAEEGQSSRPKKRTSDAAGIVDLSSDDSEGVSALDEEERAVLERLKGKMAAKRIKKEKHPVTVKQEKRYFQPGEVIELSD